LDQVRQTDGGQAMSALSSTYKSLEDGKGWALKLSALINRR